MRKKRRNILIIGFVLLIACYCSSLAFLGTGSPFDTGGLFGADTRRLLFGEDSIVRRTELAPSNNCLLGDGTLNFDGNCGLDIRGTAEPVDFDVPRDLRLTMCWGAISVNMDSENITVEDSPLPTDKNAEALTLNIFHEGDTEIDLSCETDFCRIAVNDAACPAQPQINLNAISGCSIDRDGILRLRGVFTVTSTPIPTEALNTPVPTNLLTACTMTVNTNAGDEDNPNPAAFDRDANPRALSLRYCTGDMLLSVSSDDDDLMPDYAVSLPEQSRLWTVDIYGENISTMTLSCLPNETCILALRDARCPA